MKKIFYLTISVLLMTVFINCSKVIYVTGVKLDKTSLALGVGESKTLSAKVLPGDATNKLVSWVSSDMTVATVTSSGEVMAHSIGETTIEVTTIEGNYTAKCEVAVIKAWVEISGIKWATRNVSTPGTFTAHPYDAGMFYQWNRKVGWNTTDPIHSSEGDTSWDDSYSDSEIWESANNPCPDGWRIPTKTELQSLVNSGSEWGSLNGFKGRYFGNDSVSIFLPAVGCRSPYTGELDYGGNPYGDYASYWSSSGRIRWASHMYFYTWTVISGSETFKACGFSVRCVAKD